MRLIVLALFVGAALAVGNLGAAQLYMDLITPTGQQAARADTGLDAVESKLRALYELCSSDATCSEKFYLEAPNSADLEGNTVARLLQTDSETGDQLKFYREVVLWSQQDDCPLRPNSQRGQLTVSDYHESDAAWWLSMMNTARLCGDNQVWETNRGCTIRPDRVDDDGKPVYARSTLDKVGQPLTTLSLVAMAIMVIASVVFAVYFTNRQVSQLMRYIGGTSEMLEGKAPRDTMAAHNGEFPVQSVNSSVDEHPSHHQATLEASHAHRRAL